MSVHLLDEIPAQLPEQPRLLKETAVRLVQESERARFDELLAREHYLKNADAVGAVLRSVAEYRGQWVALLMGGSVGAVACTAIARRLAHRRTASTALPRGFGGVGLTLGMFSP